MNDLKTIKTYRKYTGDYKTPEKELVTDLQIMRNLAYAILSQENKNDGGFSDDNNSSGLHKV